MIREPVVLFVGFHCLLPDLLVPMKYPEDLIARTRVSSRTAILKGLTWL